MSANGNICRGRKNIAPNYAPGAYCADALIAEARLKEKEAGLRKPVLLRQSPRLN
jgi:hypothetical protein